LVLAPTARDGAGKYQDPSLSLGMTGRSADENHAPTRRHVSLCRWRSTV